MKVIMKWLHSAYVNDTMLFFKGAIVFLIGPFDEKLKGLAVIILVDLILGINAAIRLQVFTWKELFIKMQKKIIVYGCWVVMFNIIDKVLGLPGAARNAVIFLLIGMEFVSATKNTARIGYNRLSRLMEGIYLTFMQGSGIPMEEIIAEREKEEAEKKEKEAQGDNKKKDEGGKRGGLS